MSSIHETAYPQLKPEFTENELESIYTPTAQELKFVASLYRQAPKRSVVLLEIKLLQRLGYFVALASVPPVVIQHICKRAKLRVPNKSELTRYDESRTRQRHHAHARKYVGIRALDTQGEKLLQELALQSAQTKQELPDIINVLIEELVKQRYELPSFTHLFRLARNARATVNERIFKSVAGALSPEAIQKLDGLTVTVQGRSTWDSLKREPKQPTVREVTDFLTHIGVMVSLAQNLPNTDHIAAAKREQMVLEARALDLSEMRALKPLKRYTLAVLLIQTQLQKALNDVAEIFIKTIRGLHNAAEERLRQYHLQQAEQVERLVGQFREVLTVLSEDGTSDERVARIEQSLDSNVEGWITECDEHMAYAGNNYFPFMLAGYAGKRSLLFKCLDALDLRSSSQDESLLRALEMVQKYRPSHTEHLPIDKCEFNSLDVEWMPEKWRNLVLGQR